MTRTPGGAACPGHGRGLRDVVRVQVARRDRAALRRQLADKLAAHAGATAGHHRELPAERVHGHDACPLCHCPSTRRGDYGTVVPDVDHHGLFTFHQEDLTPDARDMSSLTALALAARSSASFPGAFEPSYVPIGTQVSGIPGVPLRPDMTRFANMTRSHWVADGGLLDNRPLSPLLSSVLARRADREVRRVLAFVVPDGGGTPGGPPPAAQWARPPTMASALKMDLDAQLSQSIAGELQTIRAHNDQLSSSNDLRQTLADMGARLHPGGLVTPRLLAGDQVQQGRGLARPLAEAMMREVSALEPPPPAWAASLSPGGPATPGSAAPGPAATEPDQARLATGMVAILGGGWQPAPGETPLDEDAAWAAWDSAPDPVSRATWFGLPAFRAAQSTVLHLVRLGYRRASSLGRAADARRSSRGGHGGHRKRAHGRRFHRPGRRPRPAGRGAARRPSPPQPAAGGCGGGDRSAAGPADRAGHPGRGRKYRQPGAQAPSPGTPAGRSRTPGRDSPQPPSGCLVTCPRWRSRTAGRPAVRPPTR